MPMRKARAITSPKCQANSAFTSSGFTSRPSNGAVGILRPASRDVSVPVTHSAEHVVETELRLEPAVETLAFQRCVAVVGCIHRCRCARGRPVHEPHVLPVPVV